MVRPWLSHPAMLVLVFGLGLGCGLYFGGAHDAPAPAVKPPTSAAPGFFTSAAARDRVEANTELSKQIRSLQKELDDERARERSVIADRVAFFKKHGDEIFVRRFQWFNDGKPLTLSPEMVDILGVSKSEQQAVEQHLNEAREAMARLGSDTASLVKQTATGFTLAIPANPAGKDIEARLKEQLAGDLGSDRADYLMNEAPNYNDPFSGFGIQNVQWEVSWTEQNGTPFYSWKETGSFPDGHPGAGSGWSTGSGSQLPQQLEKFVQQPDNGQ